MDRWYQILAYLGQSVLASASVSQNLESRKEKKFILRQNIIYLRREREIFSKSQINEDFFIILKSSTDREMKIKFSDSREKTWIISSQDILDLETFVNA